MKQQTVAEGQYLAVFNSTHRILKAEEVLKRQGLAVTMIPAPRAVQTDCGMALRFNQEQLEIIMQTLQSQLLLPAFLCQLANGKYQTIKDY